MENSSSNGTTGLIQTPRSLTPIQILAVVIYCVIFILGVTANGLVIYVTGFKMKTTVNSVWFLNLALADLFYTFTITFRVINFSLNYGWPFGGFMCIFIPLFRWMCLFASILLLTVISLDRCLTVWVVVWAQNKRTPNKARPICVSIWIISLVFSIPSVLSRRVIDNRCARDVDALTNKRIEVFRFVSAFLIPFLIITCCYMAIGVRANQIRREKKIRPFLIIFAIILGFFLFWLPIHVINLIIKDQLYMCSINPNLFSSDVYNMAKNMSLPSSILAFLYSSLNPLLYMFVCKDFKQRLKQSVFLVLEHAFAE